MNRPLALQAMANSPQASYGTASVILASALIYSASPSSLLFLCSISVRLRVIHCARWRRNSHVSVLATISIIQTLIPVMVLAALALFERLLSRHIKKHTLTMSDYLIIAGCVGSTAVSMIVLAGIRSLGHCESCLILTCNRGSDGPWKTFRLSKQIQKPALTNIVLICIPTILQDSRHNYRADNNYRRNNLGLLLHSHLSKHQSCYSGEDYSPAKDSLLPLI